MKTKFPIEYLLFSFPPCCSVEVFGDREKKNPFFFSSSSKGLDIFPETGCWKHLITEGSWPEICSSSHQGESVAIPVRSPGVLWQAAPLARCGVSPAQPKLFRRISQGPRPVPGHRMGVHGCRAKKT